MKVKAGNKQYPAFGRGLKGDFMAYKTYVLRVDAPMLTVYAVRVPWYVSLLVSDTIGNGDYFTFSDVDATNSKRRYGSSVDSLTGITLQGTNKLKIVDDRVIAELSGTDQIIFAFGVGSSNSMVLSASSTTQAYVDAFEVGNKALVNVASGQFVAGNLMQTYTLEAIGPVTGGTLYGYLDDGEYMGSSNMLWADCIVYTDRTPSQITLEQIFSNEFYYLTKRSGQDAKLYSASAAGEGDFFGFNNAINTDGIYQINHKNTLQVGLRARSDGSMGSEVLFADGTVFASLPPPPAVPVEPTNVVLVGSKVVGEVEVDPTVSPGVTYDDLPLPAGSVIRNTVTGIKYIAGGASATDFLAVLLAPDADWAWAAGADDAWAILQAK